MEVPLQIVSQANNAATNFARQILVQWVRPLATDAVQFSEYWKASTFRLREAEDFIVVLRLLSTKIIARKGKDFKSLIVILFIHLRQFVIISAG